MPHGVPERNEGAFWSHHAGIGFYPHFFGLGFVPWMGINLSGVAVFIFPLMHKDAR